MKYLGVHILIPDLCHRYERYMVTPNQLASRIGGNLVPEFPPGHSRPFEYWDKWKWDDEEKEPNDKNMTRSYKQSNPIVPHLPGEGKSCVVNKPEGCIPQRASLQSLSAQLYTHHSQHFWWTDVMITVSLSLLLLYIKILVRFQTFIKHILECHVSGR